jgi:hypothetical protein
MNHFLHILSDFISLYLQQNLWLSDMQPRVFQFSNQLTTQFNERAPEAVRSGFLFINLWSYIRYKYNVWS